MEVAENPLPGLPPLDNLIPITIATIFNDFFALKETVVVYICENADGRASARNRKFNQWFERSSRTGLSFIKVDYHFGNEIDFFYTSIIMRVDNPRMADVISAFQKLLADYNQADK